MLCPATRANTRKRSGHRRRTSSVDVPIDPVEPSRVTDFNVQILPLMHRSDTWDGARYLIPKKKSCDIADTRIPGIEYMANGARAG